MLGKSKDSFSTETLGTPLNTSIKPSLLLLLFTLFCVGCGCIELFRLI